MNLFAFADPAPSSSGILISRKFWIYVLLAVPLTALTLLYWFYKSHRHRSKRQQRLHDSINLAERGETKTYEKLPPVVKSITFKEKLRSFCSFELHICKKSKPM